MLLQAGKLKGTKELECVEKTCKKEICYNDVRP